MTEVRRSRIRVDAGKRKRRRTKTKLVRTGVRRPANQPATDRLLEPANTAAEVNSLFDRIVSILEDARARVVRAVNSEMVLAYWQIGRELVQQFQAGGTRGEYGQRLVDELSQRLTQRLGRGFSTTNLRYFSTFYLAYSGRRPEIRHMGSGESGQSAGTTRSPSRPRIRHTRGGVLGDLERSVGAPLEGFSPLLGWTHYRLLMNVEHAGVLHENEQLFAARYLTYLPSVEDLQRELARERRLLEAGREDATKRRRR
jgi:hypothetical protein